MNIGWDIKTDWFLDRQATRDLLDPVTFKAFKKVGQKVRAIAQASMRWAPGPAPVGQPPHAHSGMLRRFIYYAVEPATRSLVIGPALLGLARNPKTGQTYSVPEALEYGRFGVPEHSYMRRALGNAMQSKTIQRALADAGKTMPGMTGA